LTIWSPDGRLLAAVDTPQLVVTDTSKTSAVMVFDIATGRTMWSERVRVLVGQAVFSPDGAMLATKQGDFLFEENFVTLWDSTDGTARGELDLPAGGGGLEVLRGGDVLITVGSSASRSEGAFGSVGALGLWALIGAVSSLAVRHWAIAAMTFAAAALSGFMWWVLRRSMRRGPESRQWLEALSTS
jgi:hypothetical protein